MGGIVSLFSNTLVVQGLFETLGCLLFSGLADIVTLEFMLGLVLCWDVLLDIL